MFYDFLFQTNTCISIFKEKKVLLENLLDVTFLLIIIFIKSSIIYLKKVLNLILNKHSPITFNSGSSKNLGSRNNIGSVSKEFIVLSDLLVVLNCHPLYPITRWHLNLKVTMCTHYWYLTLLSQSQQVRRFQDGIVRQVMYILLSLSSHPFSLRWGRR